MWYSLILLTSSALLYLIHFLADIGKMRYGNPIPSLMGGIALVGMILSVACFYMNLGYAKLKKRKKPIWWMIISVIAFSAFTGYIVLIIINRAEAVGIVF